MNFAIWGEPCFTQPCPLALFIQSGLCYKHTFRSMVKNVSRHLQNDARIGPANLWCCYISLLLIKKPYVQRFKIQSMSSWLIPPPHGQNGRYLVDDIFRCIFLNEKFCILKFYWSLFLMIAYSQHWKPHSFRYISIEPIMTIYCHQFSLLIDYKSNARALR